MQFHSSLSGLIVRPEMIYTNKGVAIVKFNMPYNVYNPATKKTDETQWLRVSAIGERWEKMYNDGYISEGRTITIFGVIKTVAYMSQKTGKAESTIEMTLKDFEFVQISKKNESAVPQKAPYTEAPVDLSDYDIANL